MRLFDDNDTSREGSVRLEVDRHNAPINFVDFKVFDFDGSQKTGLSASCDDDGKTIIYNNSSHRHEGILHPNVADLPEVKICKFLKDTNIIVTADLDGYLNFYAVYPSSFKNQLLARQIEYNKNEQIMVDKKDSKMGKEIAFPIRGMDYDPEE